jgi:hypothetical protein
MCAQHTWHSLGGDSGDPPAWGCSDANQCVDKVKASGRYWTDGVPPRGAWVGWKYGNNGHAALSNGDGTITTTDPSNGQPTGVEPLDYPRRWGYTGSNDYTVWTDQYNGIRFEVGENMGYKYWYSGKPGAVLHIGNEYKNMDIDEWDPPGAGLEGVLVYANCNNLVFHNGTDPGRIRLRLDRGDGDYTGYQDYTVVPGMTEFLVTNTYFEKGDGTRTWSGFKALDNLASFDIGTRYMKRWLIQ